MSHLLARLNCQPPKLRENPFLLVKPPRPWCFVLMVHADKYVSVIRRLLHKCVWTVTWPTVINEINSDFKEA